MYSSATYESNTTSNGSTEETAGDGVGEGSGIRVGRGRAVSAVSARRYKLAMMILSQDILSLQNSERRNSSSNLPVGGVLGSSGGHEGGEGKSDEVELHCEGGLVCWVGEVRLTGYRDERTWKLT